MITRPCVSLHFGACGKVGEYFTTFGTFIEILRVRTQDLLPSFNLFLNNPCPTEMTPPRRSSFQAVVVAPPQSVNQLLPCQPPPHLDVLVEYVMEAHWSPTASPDTGANRHDTQLASEGQLFQMLANLLKQLVEQRAETTRECERAACEEFATREARFWLFLDVASCVSAFPLHPSF